MDPLRPARRLAGIVACTMAAAVGWAVASGDFRAEAAALVRSPWGLATVLDVYAGLALVCGWIVARESSRYVAAGWIALIAVTGNIGVALYVLRAARAARSDSRAFWLGAR